MFLKLKPLIIVLSIILFAIVAVFIFKSNVDMKNTLKQPDLIIDNAEDLIDFSNSVNNGNNYKGRKVILKNDIVFDINTKNNFTPIGDDAKITASSGGFITNKVAKKYEFSGTFDGEGHTISGVNIKRVSVASVYAGIFSKVSKFGVVKNLRVTNSIIGGNDHIGGIVAYNEGEIENCFNQGNVNFDVDVQFASIGGIVGENKGKIIDCYNSSNINVKFDNYGSLGGIAGRNSGTIKNCYNSVNIFCESRYETIDFSEDRCSNVGGITGINIKNIENCYNIGILKNYGGGNIGSIVGHNSTSEKPKPNIINCHYLEGTSEEGVGKNDKPANTDIHMFKEGEINLDEILEKYK